EARTDNPVGLAREDFLVKPVRVRELQDWLGRRLGLRWVEAAAPPSAPAGGGDEPLRLPAAEPLRALRDAISLGHVRGITRRLDAIERDDPGCAVFVARLRELAAQFRFDAMHRIIDDLDLPSAGHDERRAA
nr:hybrid sensor histidine kinase/response regulator [Rubrivivax sp.]